MARCAKCKSTITKAQERTMVSQKDEKGRVVGVLHGKCNNIVTNHSPDKRYFGDTLNAYDMAEQERRRKLTPEQREQEDALRARQAELSELRKQGDDRGAFNDWRDPAELDINDLLT